MMRFYLTAWLVMGSLSIWGQQVYNLADVTDAFIYGAYSQYEIGRHPVGGGDFNGDGYADLIIGSDLDVCAECRSPAFVVMGGAQFPLEVDLQSLRPGDLKMIDFDTRSSVAALGDFNGDGYDDMLFGDSGASPDRLANAGQAVILYGTDVFPATMSINSSTLSGVRIKGSRFWGFMAEGRSIGSAGDVNGDGFADALLGTIGQGITDDRREAFIVYGGTDVPPELYTHQLGRHGVRIVATDPDETFGYAMTGVGDVNGDGFNDVLIGSEGKEDEPDGAYLVYGGADLPPELESGLLGIHGVRLVGTGSGEAYGRRVSGAGDVNRDGYSDLLVSALLASPGGMSLAGKTFLIFGGKNLPGLINLSNLGSHGVTINGTNFEGTSGRVLAPAGDVNGDGYDDIVIGEGYQTGRIYLLFGGPSLWRFPVIDLEDLDRIVLEHDNRLSYFPSSMASVGDINGDGIGDLVAGDMGESPYDRFVAGTCFVIYGGKFLTTPTPTQTPTITPTPETTESPTPTMTSTPTPTHQETGEFSGWILRGNGNVKVTPERE